jgi:hypothetical protein
MMNDLRGNRAGERSMREGMHAELPHLVHNKLLNPEKDLKQITVGSESLEARPFERVGVSSSGARMIRGVLHYIGKEFYGKPVRITELSATLGCVVDEASGAPKITHTFTIIPREQAKAGKGNFFLAGANLTDRKPFSAQALGVKPIPGEAPAKYEDRLEAIDWAMSHIFLNVPRGMSSMEMDKFRQFVETYGQSGLKTFLACEHYGSNFGRDIMGYGNSQAERAGKHSAEVVFGHFSIIQDQVDSLEEYIAERFKTSAQKEVLQKAAENIKRRAARFLHDLLQQPVGNTMESYKRIIQAIEHSEANAVTFSSAFRAMAESGSLAVEELAGYETYGSEELAVRPELFEAMRKMLHQNYEKHYSNNAFKQEVFSYFDKALVNPNTTFHILKNNERVVGFVRFDKHLNDKGGLKDIYFGSFNVDGPFGGGTIGETLFAAVIEQYKKLNVPIRADCDPNSVPTKKIYFPAGFAQEGEPYQLHGQESIHIIWNPPQKA